MNTAVAVVKGCLASILNFPLGRTTIGVNFPDPHTGRLTVITNSSNEPTAENISKLVNEVNKIIQENLVCYTFTISRTDAEKLYGNAMYDKNEVNKINYLTISIIIKMFTNITYIYVYNIYI